MFKELSAIKNTPAVSVVMIEYALTDIVKLTSSVGFIDKWDIHRIMIHSDRVTITLVDKESAVSFFKDVSYEFSDEKVTSNWNTTTVYRVDGYCAR